MTVVAARRQVSVDRLSDEDYTSSIPEEITTSNLRDTRWTGEVRLQSPAARRTKWLFGAFAGTRDATDRYDTYLPVIFAGYSDRNGASYEDRTLAAFGQVAQPLGSRVRVTAGLRLDHDRKRMDRADRLFGLPTPTPLDDAVAPAYSLDDTFTFLSPRVSADVMVTPSTMLFAGVARGARSGGFNFVTDNPQLAGFGGEYVLSVEGGVKGRWSAGRIEGSATAYHSAITDLQFQQFVAGFFAVANAGRATSRASSSRDWPGSARRSGCAARLRSPPRSWTSSTTASRTCRATGCRPCRVTPGLALQSGAARADSRSMWSCRGRAGSTSMRPIRFRTAGTRL
jgi:iron complex outermembrane receptor protein